MTQFLCSPIIWWCIFGVLIGWLLNSLLVRRPVLHTETTIEKPVGRKVQVVKEVEVIKEVEKIIEKPVEIIKEIEIEKEVIKEIDSPALLAEVETLRQKSATIDAMHATIELLEAKIKDGHSLATEATISDQIAESGEQVITIDNPAHLKRIKELEEELAGWAYRDTPINKMAASAYGFEPTSNDDLELILGIDFNLKSILNAAGIVTFAQLANSKVSNIKSILKSARINLRQTNPQFWIDQASMVAQNKWEELRIVHDAKSTSQNAKKAEG